MKFNRILIVVSFIWLLISFWNRNDLPGNVDYVPDLANEPQQTKTSKKPFNLDYNGVSYRVDPEYAYDITGMIVSYRHHDNISRRDCQVAKLIFNRNLQTRSDQRSCRGHGWIVQKSQSSGRCSTNNQSFRSAGY